MSIFENHKDKYVKFFTREDKGGMFYISSHADGICTLEELYQAFKERLYKEKREEFFKKGIHAESDFRKEFYGDKFEVARSEKQIELERQGHIFNGQEALDNHEIDPSKECYCGRPVK